MRCSEKPGWEIHYGPKERRTLTLGRDPVRIGSDVHCEVYVAGAPAVACTYRFENGQILCDDDLNHRHGRVASGEAIGIGPVTVIPWAGGGQARHEVAAAPTAVGPERFGRNIERILEFADGRQLLLGSGTRLSTRDIPGLEPTRATSFAEVSSHPSESGVIGLKNLSQNVWRATLASGQQLRIDPGRSIRLEPGVRIDFGTAEGIVR
jgi:hypothetical protein